MSLQIWKFKLEADYLRKISMPAGAKVLALQMQNGRPHLWASVDPEAKPVERLFETFGTGEYIPENADREYIGTYQISGMVFHVFELIRLF